MVCPKSVPKATTRRPAAAGLLSGVPSSMALDQLSAMGSRTGYGAPTRNAQWTIDSAPLPCLAEATVREISRFPHVSN